MKKIILLIGIFIFFATPALAICDYSGLCPTTPYDLSSKFGQALSKGTGATFFAEKIAQMVIKKELKKATKEKFKVSVKSYSMMDLVHGRIKLIKISGKNLDINGVYLTSLDLVTLCDFNYIEYNSKPMKFKENMVMGFSVVISDSDLMKTMSSSGYLDKLNCVNVSGCGITFFKLGGAGVKIKNNKLYFTIKVTSQLLLDKPLDIVIATDLKAENGRIVLTKVDFGNMPATLDLSKVVSRISAMNPLIFSLNVLENENTKMCIKNVKISGDKIIVSGNIFIPKNSIKVK